MNRSQDPDVRVALDALRRIVRALRLSAGEAERRLGISVAQLFALQQLSDGQPRSLGQLASETHTDPSSVSVVTRRLVERKLVAKKPSPADARRLELTLTPAGRRLLRRASRAPQARLLDALARLGARRRHEVAAGLTEVARAMGAADATLFFEEEPARAKRGLRG